jgi:hypothetical protein
VHKACGLLLLRVRGTRLVVVILGNGVEGLSGVLVQVQGDVSRVGFGHDLERRSARR